MDIFFNRKYYKQINKLRQLEIINLILINNNIRVVIS